MATMFRPDTPAKCCSYCGSREHDYEDCPKRKADAERQKEERAGQDRAMPGEPGKSTKPVRASPPDSAPPAGAPN
jgi:hypothetical protein